MEEIFTSFFENIPKAMEAALSNPLGVAVFIVGLGGICAVLFFISASTKVKAGIFFAYLFSSFLFVLILQGHLFVYEPDPPEEPFNPPNFPPPTPPFGGTPSITPPVFNQPPIGYSCGTSFGVCPLLSPLPVNAFCTCTDPYTFRVDSGQVIQ